MFSEKKTTNFVDYPECSPKVRVNVRWLSGIWIALRFLTHILFDGIIILFQHGTERIHPEAHSTLLFCFFKIGQPEFQLRIFKMRDRRNLCETGQNALDQFYTGKVPNRISFWRQINLQSTVVLGLLGPIYRARISNVNKGLSSSKG